MNVPLMITMGAMSMPETNEEVADALGVSKSEALKFGFPMERARAFCRSALTDAFHSKT